MPSTFFAIPLSGKGESFLLRTRTGRAGDFAILVDTGRDSETLELQRFLQSNAPDLRKIDRLVLTHEDADHSEGAPRFIANWINSGGAIEQVWLPAMWAPAGAGPARTGWVRSRIVKGAFEAAAEIAEAAAKIARERNALDPTRPRNADPYDDEELLSAVRSAANSSGALEEFFVEKDPGSSAQVFEEELEVADPGDHSWPRQEFLYLAKQRLSVLAEQIDVPDLVQMMQSAGELPAINAHQTVAMQLIDGALDSHSRIASVISTCIAYGVPIRWFDFGQFEAGRVATGGDAELFTPVNAVEVVIRRRPVSSKAVFYALALSRPNRECLAFLRHEEGTEPAVLFTGDSRLTTRGNDFPSPGAGLPVDRNILVTAMHHASASNQPGYAVLRTWLRKKKYPPLFVRNGGFHVDKAARGFLDAPERLCVRCIKSSLPDVPVRVEVFRGRWRMPNHPRHCMCK